MSGGVNHSAARRHAKLSWKHSHMGSCTLFRFNVFRYRGSFKIFSDKNEVGKFFQHVIDHPLQWLFIVMMLVSLNLFVIPVLTHGYLEFFIDTPFGRYDSILLSFMVFLVIIIVGG